ncbi:zinc ribbon domain-containing protein [Streptomyces sp. NPDC001933]|uniref:zinc ribbon domain-containing protein n=1 Tax=Streptomyces sp. NPDC001933 TaxID=3364626 RepID=UPI003690D877
MSRATASMSRKAPQGPSAGQTLADRVFHCQGCGMVIDRDANAARNIKNHATPVRP